MKVAPAGVVNGKHNTVNDVSLFEKIVEKMADAVVVVDPQGVVCFANHAAKDLLAPSGTALVGERFPFSIYPVEMQEVELSHEGNTRFAEMRVSLLDHGVIVQMRDVTKHVQAREAWHALSMVDELTALYNRRGFLSLAQRQLKMVSRIEGELCLLYADFDGLKTINDLLGHREGDQALIDIASLLRETFRDSDILARIGGDEFAVLAIGAIGESSTLLMKRLQDKLDSFNAQGKRAYPLSLSIGVSCYSLTHPCSLEELIHRADTLMYIQKRSRRGFTLRRQPTRHLSPFHAHRSTRKDRPGDRDLSRHLI